MSQADIASLANECRHLIESGAVVFKPMALKDQSKEMLPESAAVLWHQHFGAMHLSPTQAKEILSKGFSRAKMQVSFDRKNTLLQIESENPKLSTGVNYADGATHLSSASTNVDTRQQGVARQIARNKVAFARALGLESIDMQAEKLGAYVWEKCGFLPHDYSWEDLQSHIWTRLDELLDVPYQTRDRVRELLSSNDPRTLWTLTDLKEPMVQTPEKIKAYVDGRKQISLGKALLAGQHWFGRLDLGNNEQMEKFEAYTRPSPFMGVGKDETTQARGAP